MKIRINIKPYPAILLVVFMLLLSFPQAVLSQEERIAVVSEYEGDVMVQHETLWKTVKQIGNRIRNSAIYEEDSVRTMPASTADLVFNDNTSLKIDEDTSLTIRTREMSGDEETESGFIRKVSGKQGGVVRNINIKAGKFLANITPSKSVLTEFETPSGVASVRGTMFTLAYVGGVTSIDLTEGLVNFASAGDDVSFSIEPGDFIDVSAPELGHTSIGVRSGELDVETDTGTLTVESGESTGVNVDADTGEVTVTAEEGTVTLETVTGTATIGEGASATTSVDCTDTCQISLGAEDGTVEFETSSGKVIIEDGEAAGTKVDEETGQVSVTSEGGMIGFETSMGNVMMKEGDVVGALLDAETGEVIMTAEVGKMEFETAMGRVMMDEGDAMGAHIDADTGEMFMSAEQGDIMFETSAGTASLEHGEIVGTAFDQDTGQVTMTAMEGEVSFDTPMGMAVMQEGAVVEVTFNDSTGEVSMSSGGGTYTLETDNGIITMEDGGSMDFTVNPDTGEITVTGVTGDVVMTNEDGTTMTIESGTNLGIMHDDGHDGPMDGDGYDGQMDGDGHDGDGSKDGTFEGNVIETDGGLVYEGTMTDEFGVWTGTYDEATDTFTGTFSTNDGMTFTFNSDGTVTDQFGNTLTQQQLQQLQSQTGDTTNTNDPNNPNPPPGPVPPGRLDFNVSSIFGLPVNSVDLNTPSGVDINYQVSGADSSAATFDSSGPNLNFVQNESIYGSSQDGVLTLVFNTPTPLVNFGSALLYGSNLTSGFTVKMYDEVGSLLSTANNNTVVNTTGDGTWSEAYFNHAGSLVKKVEVLYDYNGGIAPNFRFDNLYYIQDDKLFDDFQGANIGSWWNQQLNASTRTSFGPINAKSGNAGDRFAVVHTGGSGVNHGKLGIDLHFAESANRNISFDYNFITTEFGDPSPLNDYFVAELHLPDTSTITLVNLTYTDVINGSGFTSVTGLPTGAGNLDASSGGQTGWLRYDSTHFIPSGLTKLEFHVYDAGDNDQDSAVLIDNVLDPIVEASSTDYLLTFARMLSGDVGLHEADLEADAVASAEHQAFIDKVNEVITDMENSSDSEFMAGQNEFLDRLWVARDSLASHEESAGFLQQTGVAHNLLEASIMADEGIGTNNISAIQNSLNQAKTFLVAHVNDFGETDALANIRTNIDAVLANIDNANNNEFTTATMVAIRQGIKQAFSDTIDHMNGDGHECGSTIHIECAQS